MKREALIKYEKYRQDYATGLDHLFPPERMVDNYLSTLPDEKEECEWEEEENFEYFATQCGKAYCLLDGTFEENDHKYCPFCGKKIQLKKGE